jgi:hypothetical protein
MVGIRLLLFFLLESSLLEDYPIDSPLVIEVEIKSKVLRGSSIDEDQYMYLLVCGKPSVTRSSRLSNRRQTRG